MTRSFLVGMAAAVLTAACSHQKPMVAPVPAPFPATFTFTAIGPADSAMQGTFEGNATYDNGWLTVTVPKSTITVPAGNSENWRNLSVRAFVAANYGRGNWKPV